MNVDDLVAFIENQTHGKPWPGAYEEGWDDALDFILEWIKVNSK